MKRMTAQHAQWPLESDPIFEIAGRAKKAQQELGREQVIDATIGAIMDDQGKLVAFDSVYDVLKALPNEKLAAYAPIAGLEDYLRAIERVTFAEYRPDAQIRSIATPGGSGAIKTAIWNYTSEGEDILVADWFWGPYRTISEDGGRGLRTFETFTEQGAFNLADFAAKYETLVKEQGSGVAIINSPAHNPTGYSLSDHEWQGVIDHMSKLAKEDENRRIVLVVDIAYIDYAGKGNEVRSFFKQFSNLPENMLVLVAASMSKGYTMYGQRCGALIGICPSEAIADDFYYSASHTGRANWSNGTRGAMETMIAIEGDPAKLAAYIAEKQECKDLLQKRGQAFVRAAQAAGLKILPYIDGFFVTIPYHHPKQLQEKLAQDQIYTVALGRGIRFAICAVEESVCAKAPSRIQAAIEALASEKSGCCNGGHGGSGCCGKHK